MINMIYIIKIMSLSFIQILCWRVDYICYDNNLYSSKLFILGWFDALTHLVPQIVPQHRNVLGMPLLLTHDWCVHVGEWVLIIDATHAVNTLTCWSKVGGVLRSLRPTWGARVSFYGLCCHAHMTASHIHAPAWPSCAIWSTSLPPKRIYEFVWQVLSNRWKDDVTGVI